MGSVQSTKGPMLMRLGSRSIAVPSRAMGTAGSHAARVLRAGAMERNVGRENGAATAAETLGMVTQTVGRSITFRKSSGTIAPGVSAVMRSRRVSMRWDMMSLGGTIPLTRILVVRDTARADVKNFRVQRVVSAVWFVDEAHVTVATPTGDTEASSGSEEDDANVVSTGVCRNPNSETLFVSASMLTMQIRTSSSTFDVTSITSVITSAARMRCTTGSNTCSPPSVMPSCSLCATSGLKITVVAIERPPRVGASDSVCVIVGWIVRVGVGGGVMVLVAVGVGGGVMETDTDGVAVGGGVMVGYRVWLGVAPVGDRDADVDTRRLLEDVMRIVFDAKVVDGVVVREPESRRLRVDVSGAESEDDT
jgi:hypothetical protein